MMESTNHHQTEAPMRKVVVSEFITLDGVFEDPGGAEGTKHGGWGRDSDPESGKFKYDELFSSDALLLGRKTYEEFASAWPTMEGTGDFGERMNSIPKYVVSATLEKAEWENSSIIKDGVAEAVRTLKNQPGNDILVFGSSQLISSLMKGGLVDEYRLMIYPIIVGTGKHLFEGAPKTKLKLLDTKKFGSGTAVHTYGPVGKE